MTFTRWFSGAGIVGMAAAAFFGITYTKAATTINTDDLISYWTFDDGVGISATDSVGVNVATIENADMWTTGILGGGLLVNDPSRYAVAVGTYPQGSDARTINLWYKHHSGTFNGGGHGEHILNYGDPVTGEAFGVMMYSGGTWWFYGHGAEFDINTGVAADDEWHMHTVTYNGEIVTYYLDGVEVASVERELNTGAGGMYFGNRMDPNEMNVASGIIDEVAIWDVVLSSSEITTLYNDGNGLSYPFDFSSAFETSGFGDVTKNSATLYGWLYPGVNDIQEIGFYFDIDPELVDPQKVVIESDGYSEAQYSADITGLTCDQRYYFYAYVIYGEYVEYNSNPLSFSTAECTELENEPLEGRWYETVKKYVEGSPDWTSVSVSKDGETMMATAVSAVDEMGFVGNVYVSLDRGITWQLRESLNGYFLLSSDISHDGQKMIVMGFDMQADPEDEDAGYVYAYVSEDRGVTWERQGAVIDEDFISIMFGDGEMDMFDMIFVLLSKVETSDDLSKIYFSLLNKVYLSENSGSDWENIFDVGYDNLLVTDLVTTGDGHQTFFSLINFFGGPGEDFPSVVVKYELGEMTLVYMLEEVGIFSLAISSNGRRIYILDHLGRIHVSLNEGVSWDTVDGQDGYYWVSAIPSLTGYGVFATALKSVEIGEDEYEEYLGFFYSENGGLNWELLEEIDISERMSGDGFLAMLAPLFGNVSAAYDLSLIGVVSMFDLYVVTKREIIALPPAPPEAPRRSGSGVKKAPQKPNDQKVISIEEFISEHKELFVRAYENGITLPSALLEFLGLLPQTVSVRDLHLGIEGDDVRALQIILIDQGQPVAAGATGYFGTQTQAALAGYQKNNNILPSVGYFGPLTRAFMKATEVTGLWW